MTHSPSPILSILCQFSLRSSLILTLRSVLNCFLEVLEAGQLRRLKAGDCKVVASSVFSHLHCSMSCHCNCTLELAAEPWPKVGPGLPKAFSDSWMRRLFSLSVRKETGGDLKIKHTNQKQDGLHLSTEQDCKHCHALLCSNSHCGQG